MQKNWADTLEGASLKCWLALQKMQTKQACPVGQARFFTFRCCHKHYMCTTKAIKTHH